MGCFAEGIMKKLKFETNINCESCVKAVSEFLNTVDEIDKWKVNTADAGKVLTVEGAVITAEMVIAAVEQAGFTIKEKV